MLEWQRFLIREHIGAFKLTDTYDIFASENGQPIGVAREVIGGVKKFLRMFLSKNLFPTTIEIREGPDESLLCTLHRGMNWLSTRIEVIDAQDQLIGYFQSKRMTIAGGFWVYTADDQQFAEVKAKSVMGFDYVFRTPDGTELGNVSKEFGGIAKEMFTSADSYEVTLADSMRDQPFAKMLLLAAALCIDMVFKESKN